MGVPLNTVSLVNFNDYFADFFAGLLLGPQTGNLERGALNRARIAFFPAASNSDLAKMIAHLPEHTFCCGKHKESTPTPRCSIAMVPRESIFACLATDHDLAGSTSRIKHN